MAVDPDTTAAPAENNDAAILNHEDVLFDQWIQFQSWQAQDEEEAQFINIAREEPSTEDISLYCTWEDILKTPCSEGKREGITILGPSADKNDVAKKKGEHNNCGRVSFDPNKVYLDRAATYHSMFFTWCLKNIRRVNTVLRGN